MLTLLLCLFAADFAAAQRPSDLGQTPTEVAQSPAPKTFLRILFSGGVFGIATVSILISLSLAATYLVCDHLLLIRRRELEPDDLRVALQRLIEQRRLDEARRACAERPCLLAAVVQAGIQHAGGDWPAIEKGIEDATVDQAARLFRRLEYLSLIGNLAPLVGLLGTALGILCVFQDAAGANGHTGVAPLAAGIYPALVPTVYGLLIAIPSLGFCALFRIWIDELVAAVSQAAVQILEPLRQPQPPPLPPS